MDVDKSEVCQLCNMPFDKGKKRKLIDACGHESCYMCMFNHETCPVCDKSEFSVEEEEARLIIPAPAAAHVDKPSMYVMTEDRNVIPQIKTEPLEIDFTSSGTSHPNKTKHEASDILVGNTGNSSVHPTYSKNNVDTILLPDEIKSETSDIDVSIVECTSENKVDTIKQSDGIRYNASDILVENIHDGTVKNLNAYSQEADKTSENPAEESSSKFQCEECGKKLSSKSNLQKHMIRHKDPHLKCVVCNKLFYFQSELKQHLISHSGEPAHVCKLCGVSFASPSNLQRHTDIVHNKKKPYKCDSCDKGFLSRTTLTAHQEEHKGTTPYHCNICQKGYRYKHTFQSHICGRKMKCPVEYACFTCNKLFKTRKSLKQHALLHNEPRHQCDKCGRHFVWKTSIRKHLKLCKP